MPKDELYDRALQIINDVFNDQSVDRDVTKRNLETLRDEIDVMLDALQN